VKRKLIVLGILIFLLTRKKYVIKIPESIVIPKLELEEKKGSKVTVEDIKKAFSYIDISIVTKPQIGWELKLKPIWGFNIPIRLILPITAPLAIPQIAYQLKDIEIKDYGLFYKIKTKGKIEAWM